EQEGARQPDPGTTPHTSGFGSGCSGGGIHTGGPDSQRGGGQQGRQNEEERPQIGASQRSGDHRRRGHGPDSPSEVQHVQSGGAPARVQFGDQQIHRRNDQPQPESPGGHAGEAANVRAGGGRGHAGRGNGKSGGDGGAHSEPQCDASGNQGAP